MNKLIIDDISQYDKLKKLRDNGETVWSISRLNNYNNCPHGYYLTYVAEDRDRGLQNIYSHAGSIFHDTLENLHLDRKLDEQTELNKSLAQVLTDKTFDSNLTFPLSKGGGNTIEENWVNSMTHFSKNFKRLPNHVETEKLFCFEVLPSIYVQGYIDVITTDDKGNIIILDWKTSSRFTGEKRKEAGRQLVLYKLALEKVFGLKVEKVGWYMLKYARVKYGKSSKMVDRGKWVGQISKQLEEQLIQFYGNEMTANYALNEAIKSSSLDDLPKEIQDYFKIEPLIEYYKVTPELEQELFDYIETTIVGVESEFMFNPISIDYNTYFFCENLCGQREKCSAYQRWKKEQEEKALYD